jgi:hypothetical protein
MTLVIEAGTKLRSALREWRTWVELRSTRIFAGMEEISDGAGGTRAEAELTSITVGSNGFNDIPLRVGQSVRRDEP